jgi:hypothetical protein
VVLRPHDDIVDPFSHLRGYNELLISIVRRIIDLSGNPRSLRFLFGSKLPLARNVKVLVLPLGVTGELGINLNELPPFRLEVKNSKAVRILLNLITVHELRHAQLVLLTQGQGPQNHSTK